MLHIIKYISSGLIIISFISYFILIIINKKNSISKSSGFDVSKDIISEYNSINIIESKGYFSIYNIKRGVIKLSSKCYYGKDISSITLSLIEAGISILDDRKNKYINFFGKIVQNLKILYILPLFALILNCIFYTVTDAWIGIVLLSIFCFIVFILIDIKTNIYNWLCDDLVKIKDISKNNQLKILDFVNIIIWLDKLIFVGETIMIIRFIMILLGIS